MASHEIARVVKFVTNMRLGQDDHKRITKIKEKIGVKSKDMESAA